MQQGMAHYIIPRNTSYKTNSFLIIKIEGILSLIEPMSKKNSLYRNLFDKKDLILTKKDLIGINKVVEISNRNKNIKMSNIRHIISKNKYITSNQLKSEIESIQSKFKLIKFNDSKKQQSNKLINKKNIIVYMANILNE